MLEQIQRDLFALGARLADPAHKIAERVDEGRGRRATTSSGSSAGSIARGASCRRCGASFSPAARRPAPRCTSRAPSAAAPNGPSSRSAADGVGRTALLIYINRLSDLLFVMARAANHRAGTPEIEW